MTNSNLISLKKAIQLIDKEKKNLFKISKIKLSKALNKVVAEDILSPINLPSLDCAGLDGFVFNSSHKSKLPISKKIITPGKIFKNHSHNYAYRINTGAIIPKNLSNFEKSLIIVSADFSHFLDLQTAIEKENCATHAILHREIYNNLECLKHVDIIDSFKLLYKVIPSNWYLQWIGRTRSPGVKGVGYLSFLIKQPQAKIKNPDGIFVTAYDEKMHQRECLGEWFNNNYSVNLEQNLIDRVVNLAKTTSRLTNGNFLEIPITNYTVTYLYRDHKNIKFIRGYHSIKSNAFYLSDVLLENCFDDGIWITQEHVNWPQDYKFKLSNTLKQLKKKAQNFTRKTINRNKNTIKNTIKNKNLKNLKKSNPYQLYYSDVYYGKITNK